MKNGYKVVFVTTKDEKEGERIAKLLIEKRVAGCVNIVPKIRSIYSYNNKIVNESESLLIIKTVSSKYRLLEEMVIKSHSYEIPEIISIDIREGSDTYLQWLNSSIY